MALALVAKAAGGSVRDSLSILGQLVAGSGPAGVSYSDAVLQLGLTDGLLLDEAISAIADADGPTLFSVADRVVEAGLDPRRFAADMLERLRDLIVLHQIPDAESSGLVDAPDEQLATMRSQVDRFSLVQLSRAADLVNGGLTELKGATAPRLQLELLCARLLLPMSDSASVLARLDQLERGVLARPAADPPAPAKPSPPPQVPVVPAPAPAPPKLSSIAPTTSTADAQAKEPAKAAEPPVRSPVEAPPADSAPEVESALDITAVATMWPAVLEALKASSRVAHTLAEGSAPISRTSKGLVIAHPDRVRMDILRTNKGHVEHLRIAILDVVRIDTDVDFTHNPDPSAPAPTPAAEAPPPADAEEGGPKKSARERIAEQVHNEVPVTEDVAADDDADLDDSGLSGLALIQRELGGTVMTEYEND
jgi:DNA polymerase-3 subunit gamma/tau